MEERLNSGPVPRVSIGLPVYNGEVHLAPALDSLLNQSFADFEIIVSDNHSTDATEAICRDYSARDPRIRYHREDRNRGAAWNFNRVLDLSGGHYFKWASANDLHAPDYLFRCVEVLDTRPEVVLCYPKTRLIDEDGAVICDFEDNLDLPWPQAARRFKEFLVRVQLSNAFLGLIRPGILKRVGRLGTYPGADVVLLGELTLYGAFSEVPEFLFYRRKERQNIIGYRPLHSLQEFYDPNSRGKISMRTWRHQYEYLVAALRTPLPLADKARVVGHIARVCISVRAELARELAGAASQVAGRRPVRKA
jgi:glycosyltransferase involved in cell wall biosynthesis